MAPRTDLLMVGGLARAVMCVVVVVVVWESVSRRRGRHARAHGKSAAWAEHAQAAPAALSART
ncbi:hypothetical protein [Cupriavidus basilensis]